MRIAYDAAPLLNPRTGVGHYAAALLEALLAPPSRFAPDRGTETSGDHLLAVDVLARNLRTPDVVASIGWTSCAPRPSGSSLPG